MAYEINKFNFIGMGGTDRTLGPLGTVIANNSYSPDETMKIYGIKDSLLEKKSFLQFEYADDMDPDGPPKIVRLPFYEDPEIRESKSARYASYKPVSRASELFAYLGSDARSFNLTFKLTLPHLINMLNTDRGIVSPKGKSSLEAKKEFFGSEYGERDSKVIGPRASDYDEAYSPQPYSDAESLREKADVITNELGYPLTPEGYLAWSETATAVNRKKGEAGRDLLVYWIDIIRTSVYNNVQNPVLGPPIVRLTHGILYRGIPCITTNYSLSFDPNTGYDKDTMIPRVLKVDMELKEIRAGDFTKFDASEANSIKGENLAGWEAVITSNTNQIGGTLDVVPDLGGNPLRR